MTSSEQKEPKGSASSSTECRFTAVGMSHCFEHTDSRCCGCNTLDPNGVPEPPMTPEEEEQAPADEPLPPQPVRRPPYAIAYSVQGHLYEVALSGDATVRAVDGSLVITHALGPIAGIVQAAPYVSEERP